MCLIRLYNTSLNTSLVEVQKLEAAAKEAEAQSTKIFRLEVQLAEVQKKLQTVSELEKELNRYRLVLSWYMTVSKSPCLSELMTDWSCRAVFEHCKVCVLSTDF